MIAKLTIVISVVSGLVLISQDSAAPKSSCCVKGAYCCKIQRDCCPAASAANLARAETNDSVAGPTCCAKHAFCCSSHRRCCATAPSANGTLTAADRTAATEAAAVPNCCTKRAYCCKRQQSCCRASANPDLG